MTDFLPYVSAPEKYGVVESGVYRSNALYAVNFPFVKRLGLKTVVYLSPEAPIRAVTQFLEENKITFIHLGLRSWKPHVSWKPISEEMIKDALEMVLDIEMHPLMVMCTSGVHQTGTLVGCLRRLQNWNLTSSLEEYRFYAGTKARYVNEQFIELFDEDLVTLPRNMPSWFVDQWELFQEETREIRRIGASGIPPSGIPPAGRPPPPPPTPPPSSPAQAPPAAAGGGGEAEAAGEGAGARKGTVVRFSDGCHDPSDGGGGGAGAGGGAGEGGGRDGAGGGDGPGGEGGDGGGSGGGDERQQPAYLEYYFARSGPLTTEKRSYAKKLLGKKAGSASDSK